jgi:hypothetical protein
MAHAAMVLRMMPNPGGNIMGFLFSDMDGKASAALQVIILRWRRTTTVRCVCRISGWRYQQTRKRFLVTVIT